MEVLGLRLVQVGLLLGPDFSETLLCEIHANKHIPTEPVDLWLDDDPIRLCRSL